MFFVVAILHLSEAFLPISQQFWQFISDCLVKKGFWGKIYTFFLVFFLKAKTVVLKKRTFPGLGI